MGLAWCRCLGFLGLGFRVVDFRKRCRGFGLGFVRALGFKGFLGLELLEFIYILFGEGFSSVVGLGQGSRG